MRNDSWNNRMNPIPPLQWKFSSKYRNEFVHLLLVLHKTLFPETENLSFTRGESPFGTFPLFNPPLLWSSFYSGWKEDYESCNRFVDRSVSGVNRTPLEGRPRVNSLDGKESKRIENTSYNCWTTIDNTTVIVSYNWLDQENRGNTPTEGTSKYVKTII